MKDPNLSPAAQMLLDDLEAAEMLVRHSKGAAALDLHRLADGNFSPDEAWGKLPHEKRLELANAIRMRRAG
jgi:hypothetical protein